MQIEFRVWDKAFECFIPMETIPNPIPPEWEDRIYSMRTPFRDKKGIPIWEGDIVKVPEGWSGDYHADETYSEVTFDEDGFWADMPEDCSWNQVEVIGNIFQNPLLLDTYFAQKELDKEFPT